MELTNRKKWLIVMGTVLVLTIFIFLLPNSDDLDLPPLDETDHKSVSLYFVMKNGKIANVMGKVVKSSHVGNGGSGSVSHNVLKLNGVIETGKDKGKETSAICDLTLKRIDGKYVPTKAMLNMKGNEINIPVKGLKARGKRSMSVIK